MPTNFESYEFNTTLFVVKIWLEEIHDDHKGKWRGYITHVTSGERQYIEGLLGILFFIIPYLIKMRAKISWFWRIGDFIIHQKKSKLKHSESLSEEESYRSTS